MKPHADVSVKAWNEFIPSLLVTQVGVDDTLSRLKPQNEEKGGTHAYAERNRDTPNLEEEAVQETHDRVKSRNSEHLFGDRKFEELLAVIQLPSHSKETVQAIKASSALDLDEPSSILLTKSVISLLTALMSGHKQRQRNF